MTFISINKVNIGLKHYFQNNLIKTDIIFWTLNVIN